MRSEKEGEKLLPKDALSMANAVAGLCAIYEAFYYDLFSAFILLLIAVALDFFDGYIARKSREGPTKLGRELDSLADMVSFGVAPVVMMFILAVQVGAVSWVSPNFSFSTILFYAASAVYLLCALTRLAKFNVQKEDGIYHGLPSPIAALIVSGTSVLLRDYWDKLFCTVTWHLQCVPYMMDYVLWIQAFVLAAAGGLMIAKFKTRKFW